MRILHYTIGFSPERSGGLPRYATDLMNEQANQGHEVFALYPGRINILKKNTYMKETTRDNVPKVKVYELFNSLPLPLFGGIKNPDDFMKRADSKVYQEFLENLKLDVIHIHSLMGLHKEFLEVAKLLNIKMIFTSHDYFGLSPVPDFYIDGKSYDNDNTNEFWNRCAVNALSTNKLRVLQLSFYPTIRKIINYLKKSSTIDLSNDVKTEVTSNHDFSMLKKYYKSAFELIDVFHFNSYVAKDVYSENLKFLKKKAIDVITITNTSITQSNCKKNTKFIRNIAYIGPYKVNKGFYEFINFAEMHKGEGFNFYVYGDNSINNKISKNIMNYGKYEHSELKKIFSSIDLLIVPSLWKETFGFLVLEAISFGVPVMVSRNVGAKILLEDSKIFEDLKEVIIPKEIDSNISSVKTIVQHTKEIIRLYERE